MLRKLTATVALLCASFVDAQWQPVDTTASVTALYSTGDTLIWGTPDGTIRWSEDQGQTWEDISGTLPSGWVDNIGQGAGDRLFCTVGSLVYRSDVLGSWAGAASFDDGITCMAIDDSLILVGAGFTGGLQRSVDNGMSWSYAGTPMASSYLTSVATDGNMIWASRFGADAMFSADSGSTWSPIPGLSGINIFCLFHSEGLYAGDEISIHCPGTPWNTTQVVAQILDMDRSAGYLAACGTFPGVFISTDGCANWQAIEAGHTTFQINAIAFIGSVIYAGNSDGLWKLDLDIWSGIERAQTVERALIWPNPAIQDFTFTLSEHPHDAVDVDILDLSGRIVRSRSLASAMRNVSLDGLSSGRYTVRFRTSTGTASSVLVIGQ